MQARTLLAEKEKLEKQLEIGRRDGTLSFDGLNISLQTQLEAISMELRQATDQNQQLARQVERLNQEKGSMLLKHQKSLEDVRSEYDNALFRTKADFQVSFLCPFVPVFFVHLVFFYLFVLESSVLPLFFFLLAIPLLSSVVLLPCLPSPICRVFFRVGISI